MQFILLLYLACSRSNENHDGSDTEPAPDTDETGRDDSGGETGEPPETGETGGETGTGPVDGDGDGYTDDLDCDDGDTEVHPGAEDPCDAFDQDCDGGTWSPGSCGEDLDLADAPVISDEDNPVLYQDLTGDGIADMIVASDPYVGYEDPNGVWRMAWALYPGGAVPEEPLDAPTDAALVWFMGQDTFYFGLGDDLWPLEGGDVDGDGTNDLLMIDHGYYYGVYVHLGPFSLDGGVRWMNEDADAIWTGNVLADYCWMMKKGYGEDLDGDGRADFVGSSSGGCDAYPGDAFNVFLGGTWGDPVAWVHTEGTYGVEQLEQLEDLDGDGVGDVHVRVNPTHFLLSGADLPSADGAYVEDLAFATTGTDGGAAGALVDHDWLTAGDWTGDGLADLLIPAPTSETLGYRHGELFVIAGGMAGEFTVDDAAGSWVGTTEGGTAGVNVTPDADGDGEKELLYWDGSDHILLRHELPALRTPASGLRFPADEVWSAPFSDGDLDDDGYDDFSFARFPTGDASERVGHVWLGFDIPWDDPSAWSSP